MTGFFVVAVHADPTQPSYFAHYRDNGDLSESVWTCDRWQARWFGADEAEIEAELLSLQCLSYHLEVEFLSGVRRDK